MHAPLIPLPFQTRCLERGLDLPDEVLLDHLDDMQANYVVGQPQVMVDRDDKLFFLVE